MTKKQAIQVAIDRWIWASKCADPKEYLALNPCSLCNHSDGCDNCVLQHTGICSGLYWEAVCALDDNNLPDFKRFAKQIIRQLEALLCD